MAKPSITIATPRLERGMRCANVGMTVRSITRDGANYIITFVKGDKTLDIRCSRARTWIVG